MLTRQRCGFRVPAKCSSDTAVSVCGDAHADTRAADKNAKFAFTACYFVAYPAGIYWVIYGIFRVCSEIHAFISAFRQMLDEPFFVVYAGMIRRYCNFDSHIFFLSSIWIPAHNRKKFISAGTHFHFAFGSRGAKIPGL